MRVVIDTNIWISYLMGSLLKSMDEKILSKKIQVVISKEMLRELNEVSNRSKFKIIFTQEKVKELFSLLDNYAIIVFPKQRVEVCRDKKDNFLLEVAMEGRAEYLITGDEDLIVLNKFHFTKIVKPKKFEDILKLKDKQ